MDRNEKRTHRRLDARYDVSCRKIGSIADKTYPAHTGNVSSGGLYIQTVAGKFEPGDLLHVELTVPPTPGLLEFGGKIAGCAKVLRVEKTGFGLRFCRRPKLCL